MIFVMVSFYTLAVRPFCSKPYVTYNDTMTTGLVYSIVAGLCPVLTLLNTIPMNDNFLEHVMVQLMGSSICKLSQAISISIFVSPLFNIRCLTCLMVRIEILN
jgi:hypothetical protein